ncbi:MAG: alpha-amylase family glycosyl hydrolase [Bacteroidota bacterium]|jgi:glycosidase
MIRMPLKLIAFLILQGICTSIFAQLQWSPAFITETSSSISIKANANLGNKGLLGYTPSSDVYVHIGAITNLSSGPSGWKFVKFDWGTTNPAANAPSTGANEWTFTINGGLRSFFGITNANEKIEKIAILFRSGNGNRVLRNDDASDMYIPVYPAGDFIRIDEPTSQPKYIRTLQPINVKVGENMKVTANATATAKLQITHNGDIKATAENSSSINKEITITKGGSQQIIAEANFSNGTVQRDTIQFFLAGNATIAALPTGIREGVTYEAGDTSAYLVIHAPGKNRIALIGDFNNWTENEAAQMNKTPDGNNFWIRITGLKSGIEYAYQFLIDGSLRVADYNTEKVLDQNNDGFIPSANFPNLKSFPKEKTSGIVSILQTGKPSFSWKVGNFKRPDKRNLIIYELLIRDFLANQNFQTLKDTIPYLKKLGVNTIQLMPVTEFEGNLSWGYNPNFFFAVDKYYGTEQALKAFIDECHAQGMAVVLDMVMNHAFGSSPVAQMYWDTTNNKPSTTNPWLNPDAKHPYNVGYDFNHESAATKNLLNRMIRHWLINYKLDGFRWDLSKGFTQTNNPNNVSAWGNYDASRIATWKRIYDTMQLVSNGSYCILEHFADNAEEKELADYGMMFWGNGNYNFNQATMGYSQDADFSGILHSKRNWQQPHLIGYMESHDEERLMYKNISFGNQSVNYSTRDSNTALLRMSQAAAFWSMMPGPKMLWQFGELGFPFSINTCGNGTVNSACRLDNKPPVWSYLNNPFKKSLFNKYANLFKLRTNPSFITTFTSTPFTYDLSTPFKWLQINGDSLKVMVIGNFDIASRTSTVNFPNTGIWYSYLNGTSINLNNASTSITLEPGEFHVYLNKNLSNTIITSVSQPILPNADQLTVIPNPIHESTMIGFKLSEASLVDISLVDNQGRIVEKILHSFRSAGHHSIPFPQSKLSAKAAGNGIYYVMLKTNNGTLLSKHLLYY